MQYFDHNTSRFRCNNFNIVPDFRNTSLKRKYDEAFGQITAILNRYEIIENPRNLRIRFTLCMQEFFDSVPKIQWRTNDPAFIKQAEKFAITKFKEWIIEEIT